MLVRPGLSGNSGSFIRFSFPHSPSFRRLVISEKITMDDIRPDSSSTLQLLGQAAAGDEQALGQLLQHHLPRVKAAVDFRIDRRVQARFDASDVVQETQLEVTRRFDEFLNARPIALDVCEHFNEVDCYRVLVQNVLPAAHISPLQPGSGFVTHYSTYDWCPKCEEGFEE